jgi:hypothetical protein
MSRGVWQRDGWQSRAAEGGEEWDAGRIFNRSDATPGSIAFPTDS